MRLLGVHASLNILQHPFYPLFERERDPKGGKALVTLKL